MSTTDADESMTSDEERNTQIFAKQMLQGRLFLGHFQEKRYVESLAAYRNVVVINESENQLISDVKIVGKRLSGYYGTNRWIGITNPNQIGVPNGHCFWVESTSSILGYYWYQIKTVRFKSNEILLKLKIIRPMTEFTNNIADDASTNINPADLSVDEVLKHIKNGSKENFVWFFSEIVTISNIKSSITFIFILLATILTSALYGIQFFMEFSLKLMRELSVFIQSMTPFMISVVNLLAKIVCGFYMLIAMLFKGNSRPRNQNNEMFAYHRPAIEGPRFHPGRSSVIIEEVE